MSLNEIKKEKDLITLITASLPVVGLMILMFGAAKQFAYYYCFGFNVFPFLEISELLPQSIFDLILFLFYLIVVGIITPILNLIIKPTREIEENKQSTVTENLKQIENNILKRALIWIVGAAFLILTMIDFITAERDFGVVRAIWFILLFSFTILFITIVVFVIDLKFSLNLNAVKRYIVILLIFMIANGLFNGYKNYNDVHNHHSHKNYSITITGKKIISNDKFYYIGKSKNDIFFFDVATNLVTIFPTSSINEMSISSE